MLDNIEIIRKYETHIPTVVVTVGRDGGRRRASAFVDLHAPYGYPVARRKNYRWYADYLDHNRKIMDRQFNWTCPETTGLTAAQIRLETIIGLAHGIRGFMFWPGPMLVDHRLAELGILCLEVEPLTELIVEAEHVIEGASCDNDLVEAQRIDWGAHTLLFLTHYRDRSVRWIDGKLASPATVTVRNLGAREAASMTLDLDLKVGPVERAGRDLKLTISGLDVGAMVLLTPDAKFAERCQQQLEARRRLAAEFASTANRYMSWVVYEILFQIAQMRAPLGGSVELYHQALEQIEKSRSFTEQRRAARLLRESMAQALVQADELAGYAPAEVASGLEQWFTRLPRFMASFNVRALRDAPRTQVKAPRRIAPMAPLTELPRPEPLEVGQVIGDRKGKETEGFVARLKGRTCYGVFQTGARRLSLYPDQASYVRGQTARRAPLVFSEYVDVPGDLGRRRAYLVRPDEDMDLYVIATKRRATLGLVSAQQLPLGSAAEGPQLSPQKPLALYEVEAGKGDSFEVTVKPSTRYTVDVRLCQAHPRYAQMLASARVSAGTPQSLRCTLPDEGPLVVVVMPHAGKGTFTIVAKRIEGKVVPQPRDNPFRDVRFGIFGKEPASFTPHLAAGGIRGDRLDATLAAADLSKYHVVVLLTNALRYDTDGELAANAEKLKQFVHNGGHLVLFQQNGWVRWDDSILPYRLELLKAGRRYKPPVVVHEELLGDFSPADLVGGPRRPTVGFYPAKLDGRTDEHWRVLAYSGESKNEALAVSCEYGEGKVILNQFAVLDRIYEPIMRTLMVETVRHVVEVK